MVRKRVAAQPAARPKRPQGQPTARAPQVQAKRLIGRLIRRGEKKLGVIGRGYKEQLAKVDDPRDVERLLSLLHSATSWGGLLAMWQTERVVSESPVTAG